MSTPEMLAENAAKEFCVQNINRAPSGAGPLLYPFAYWQELEKFGGDIGDADGALLRLKEASQASVVDAAKLYYGHSAAVRAEFPIEGDYLGWITGSLSGRIKLLHNAPGVVSGIRVIPR
jgi:hypothetical protein